MGANANLHKANKQKNDEFYTRLEDIEMELKHYKNYFKNKVIFCNCDDPFESNFFKYFAMNFNNFGIKKLIATCYSGSPVSGMQLSFFKNNINLKKAYKIEITEVKDVNHDGAIDLSDVEFLIKNNKNILSQLSGNGDFRSFECIELLKESDLVITNPPFSLFREYVAQLHEYNKKFIILSNLNAIGYKEIFPLLQKNKMWIGYGFNMSMIYKTPYPNLLESNRKYVKSKGLNPDDGYLKVPAICWFTNLDISKRHEDIPLYKSYTPEEYPMYDNYRAINVNKVAEIPCDYYGVMGVPITFLDKFNPDKFEILGLSQKVGFGLKSFKFYDDYKEVKQDGTFTGSSGRKTNGNPVMKGKPKKGNYYTNGKEYVYSLYGRVFIRKREKNNEYKSC